MAESSGNNNADMAFPSPYLRNPVPFFNSGDDELAYTHLQGSPPSVQQSREGLPLLDEKKVRAAVAELLVFGFKGTSLNRHARSLISMGAGGVILFARNVQDPEQVARLSADLKRKAGNRSLMIMVDQEGGYVQRLGPPFTVIPHARTVGETGDVHAAAAVASVIGKELRAVNIDMNLAPVLDVDMNLRSTVVGKRSFGVNSSLVSEFGYAFIRGLQREGVAACAKHYPGHGDVVTDSHLDIPLLPHGLKHLMEVELPPFSRAVDADVAALMVAHLNVPCFYGESMNWRPASMSKGAIDHLRNVLQFEGVVLADCLEMGAIVRHFSIEEAAVEAILAGVDMLLVSHTKKRQVAVINALVREVLLGRIPFTRIEEACSRIAALKHTYVRFPPPQSDRFEENFWRARVQTIGCKEHHDLMADIVHQAAVESLW
ncbi:unnamed protein product [Sphagnum jensenii]|uniref:Glycoside hydrolase family 3 N-terminal domain-containing protein n=1 Tax=Sphagnum jensenii TaxID=128206 RepID=A0ABP0X226_9BRYO